MNTEFKVGQKVYSLAHGWGEVESINESIFPLVCRFNMVCASFTIDGRLYEHTPICLFHYEPEIIVPKWQPKNGEWCLFWDEGFVGAALMRFKIKGDAAFVTDTNCPYDNCAPFVGELPEHLKNL